MRHVSNPFKTGIITGKISEWLSKTTDFITSTPSFTARFRIIMTAIKPFLNQLLEPVLILLSFPIPLFSPSHSPTSSNAFDEIEFPRRGFPLAVTDWRDMLVYLYTSRVQDVQDERHAQMRLGMRKHAEGLRIGEVRRYVRDGHHIVVAQVVEEEGGKKSWVVRNGLRLLRFERGAAVNDAAKVDEAFAASMNQDFAATGSLGQPAPILDQPSKDLGSENPATVSSPPVLVDMPEGSGSSNPADDASSPPPVLSPTEFQPIAETSKDPAVNSDLPSTPPPAFSTTEPPTLETVHPSISIYSAHVRDIVQSSGAGGDEGSFLDTVQSTVERDLQGWTLAETVHPKALYLHHLALLVAEVHECSVSLSDGSEGSGGPMPCVAFADVVMAVLKDEAGPGKKDDVAGGKVADGSPVGEGEVGSTKDVPPSKKKDNLNLEEAVQEIQSRYLKAKIEVEKKIYGTATESASHLGALNSVNVQVPSGSTDIESTGVAAVDPVA